MLSLTEHCTGVQSVEMHKAPPVTNWWIGPITERGRRWAEHVYEKTRGKAPWPTWGGSAILHAKRAIVDMLPTLPLADEMMKVCFEAARARYEELCQRR